jgi:hypothetical protein
MPPEEWLGLSLEADAAARAALRREHGPRVIDGEATVRTVQIQLEDLPDRVCFSEVRPRQRSTANRPFELYVAPALQHLARPCHGSAEKITPARRNLKGGVIHERPAARTALRLYWAGYGVRVSSSARSWTLRSSASDDADAPSPVRRTIRTTCRTPPHGHSVEGGPFADVAASLRVPQLRQIICAITGNSCDLPERRLPAWRTCTPGSPRHRLPPLCLLSGYRERRA